MHTVPMAGRVAAAAKRQHGLVTTDELAALGLSVRQIEGWMRAGRLERLLPGVLRVAGAPATLEQTVRAAVLWGGPGAVASHRSAAELWRFDGLKAARPEITVPIDRTKRSAHVVSHRSSIEATGRRLPRGVPTTTPERTIVDLAGVTTAAELEIAFESARRERLLTVSTVAATLDQIDTRGRSGTGALHRLLATLEREPPAESPLEVMAARLLRASDLAPPQRQVEIGAAGARYRLDFAWPEQRVALECDGRKWHEIESAFEHDRARWSAITAATGYRFVWATWRRVGEQPERLIAELREALRHPNDSRRVKPA